MRGCGFVFYVGSCNSFLFWCWCIGFKGIIRVECIECVEGVFGKLGGGYIVFIVFVVVDRGKWLIVVGRIE